MQNTAQWLRKEQDPSLSALLHMVVKLSIPAVLAEISSIAMQYIDAAMVGDLGAAASASIGLVSSTTWLFGGLGIAVATGFSVQVAHRIGAGEPDNARTILRQALMTGLGFGLFLAAVGVGIHRALPVWLGGAEEVLPDASRYFLIYACALPAAQLRQVAGSMLQCSGDMRTPSVLNTALCFLDVLFNALLIFPTRRIALFGRMVTLPGAGLGVAGAALGTALAEISVTLLMLWAVCGRSPTLRLSLGGSWKPNRRYLLTAVKLAVPMALEHVVLCGAQIAITRIVSPLGTIAVAANSLAVTAESLCYMPGYGISAAATTLVGQSVGASRRDLACRFADISVALGAGIMACTGAAMFLFAPQMFFLLTPDQTVQALGVQVLRIEAFAEPLFGVSIVAAGALRGAGDSLIPSVLNLASMWGVRITSSLLLVGRFGLVGVWIAMCVELCVRGVLFLVRLRRRHWLPKEAALP